MASRLRDDHLFGPGPKRILALDGGGIRGLLTLQYLYRIEEILRERHGEEKLVLSDYFDLIAGTSTGSIIAACLATGMSVSKIHKDYNELAKKIFKRKGLGFFSAKFQSKPLEKELKKVLGEYTTLGSSELRTGLLIVAKRFDTTSPWPMTNNPKGKFFARGPKDKWIANGDFPLWKVVRASTAAPYYFDPEPIEVSREEIEDEVVTAGGVFLDGGVSPHNNPALQAVMVASLGGFKLGWEFGANKLSVTSVGTGKKNPKREPAKTTVQQALGALQSVMDDCAALNETILQWMSHNPQASEIDMEIGNLADDFIGTQPLLTYHRYNVEFSPRWVDKHLGLERSSTYLDQIAKMDDPSDTNINGLTELGAAAATKQVSPDHFPTAFDLK